jgi:hypothetical protein
VWYRVEDVRFIRAGPATTILVYRGNGSRDGEGDLPSINAMMASADHLVDGHGRLAVYEQTMAA